jgi:hypothetical protein
MKPASRTLRQRAGARRAGMRGPFRGVLNAVAVASEASQDAGRGAPSRNDDDFWSRADDWRAMLRPYVVVQTASCRSRSRACCCTTSRMRSATGRPATTTSGARSSAAARFGNVKGIAWSSTAPAAWSPAASTRSTRCTRSRPQPGSGPRLRARERLLGSLRDLLRGRPHHVSRTGGVGSIGVVTTHVDVSKALDKAASRSPSFSPASTRSTATRTSRCRRREGAHPGAHRRALRNFRRLGRANRGLDEQAVRDTEALTSPPPSHIERVGRRKSASSTMPWPHSRPICPNHQEMKKCPTRTRRPNNQAAIDTAVAAATAN